MKNAVANLADLLDRQMALLVDSRYNNGLPANLSGAHGPRAAINHGLKGVADQRLGLDGGSAQVHHAGVGVLAFHRMPQPGQSQHGHDRGARLFARAGVDRAGRRGAADHGATGRVAALQLKRSVAPEAPLKNMMDALGADIAVIEEDRRLEPDLRLLLERIATALGSCMSKPRVVGLPRSRYKCSSSISIPWRSFGTATMSSI